MTIDELMDGALLQEMVDRKYVRVQAHPALPHLRIFNYTEHAQFDREWNQVTRQCRGLIVNIHTGKVLARPFPKFFNHGEPEAAVLDLDVPAHISDKMDGSLGIMYPVSYSSEPPAYAIATRGSFTSEQAVQANRILLGKYPGFQPPGGITLLYEIVYPQNRIVLDYGDVSDLFLLGGVDIETGIILGPRLIPEWTGPSAEVMSASTLREALALPMRPNAEGVVVRTGRDMVKLKQEDYVALHRIITNTSARVIWEHLAVNACKDKITEPKQWPKALHIGPERAQQVLAAGEDWQEKMLHGVPDEFYGWFRETTEQLTKKVEVLRADMDEIFTHFSGLHEGDRKGFALAVQGWAKAQYSGILFQLLDGRDITANLWTAVYPPAEKPWGQRSEDVS